MAMGYRDPSDVEFVTALEAFKSTAAELRSWLLGGFAVHIPPKPPTPATRPPMGASLEPSTYWALMGEEAWILYHLENQKGERRAGDIISELILTKGGSRVVEVVQTEANDGDVFIRADDPELVHVLYEEDLNWLSPLGEYVLDYYKTSRPPEPDAKLADIEDDPELDDDLDEPDDLKPERVMETIKNLRSFLRATGPDRKSAEPHAGLAFIRVATTSANWVTIDPSFSEAQLEAHILAHWKNIDWGFQTPLYLVGSQVQLDAETRDRADIVAQSGSGQPVVIELKIGEAKPRDVSQLQAYMTHLEKKGQGRPFGILVAESFPHRVKNAVLQIRRIRLLKFRVPGQK
jgi:hypothetical protein